MLLSDTRYHYIELRYKNSGDLAAPQFRSIASLKRGITLKVTIVATASNMAKCSVVARYNHKVPSSLYSTMSRKALKKIFQMKGDAVKILTILSEKLAWMRARDRHDSTVSCPPELNSMVDPLREQKSKTFPRSGSSRKLGFRQRKLSLTVEQERGFVKDYSNSSLPEGKKQKGPKVKTYFEVDFEDSTSEEEIDIEELKRILASFNSKHEGSIEGDGFLTTTLCSTEL